MICGNTSRKVVLFRQKLSDTRPPPPISQTFLLPYISFLLTLFSLCMRLEVPYITVDPEMCSSQNEFVFYELSLHKKQYCPEHDKNMKMVW